MSEEKCGKDEATETENISSSNRKNKLEQVKILVAGQVDASKSTTIGVLVHKKLDSSEDPMALKVDKFDHEKKSGKTSSVSSHYMISDKKIIELCNLCGHQKYLKNTLYGISGNFADYGMLLVNVNRGITEMGFEHLNIFVHLNIPFFVVLTKIDLCVDKDMYTSVHKQLHKELRKCKRQPVSLRVDKDYNLTENYTPYVDFLTQRTNIVPIFCISNRTGKNIDILRDFLFNLQSRPLWKPTEIVNNVFFITSVYMVKHVGMVVSGVVKSNKSIKVTDTWYIGPYNGKYIPVRIKSIHNDIREDVDELTNGESGCICIKFGNKDEPLTKQQILKGMVLTDDAEKIKTSTVTEFTARVMILQHHTSVKSNFQSVLHIGPVRQTARISTTNTDECLRTGDVSVVRFKWLFRPEYVEVGTRFFGREGSCRFCGEVISIDKDYVIKNSE